MSHVEKYEAVPVVSFQIGRQLPFDIYEARDVLLLKRGSVIAPRFVRTMQHRSQAEVFVLKSDIKRLMPEAAESNKGGFVDYETAGTRALDTMTDDSALGSGPPLMDRIKPRQAVPYDNALVNEMLKSREQNTTKLTESLTELVQSTTEVQGAVIEGMTTNFIWNMAQDLDATLNVAQLQQKGKYLANHSIQVSIMGMALAAEMKMDENEARLVGISGMLQDVGMGKVPEHIVEAKRRLAPLDFLEVMKHPIYGVDMAERVLGIPGRVRLVIYQVHERENGSGYPRKRKGRQTFHWAKLLGMVDAYLAMISDRPYRDAMLPYHAMERIVKETNQGVWDPHLTRSFLSLIGLFPVGSFVMLSDESMARVMRSGGANFAKPQINIMYNSDGVRQKSNTIVDLAQEGENGLKVAKAIPPLFDYDD